MDETDDISIANEGQGVLGVKLGLVAIRVDEPIIVGVLVMIAGHLLLS
jgi:hypothetical protein